MKIYSLRLHEEIIINPDNGFVTRVMRVPGGWVYNQSYKGDNSSTSVFVPFYLDRNLHENEEEEK